MIYRLRKRGRYGRLPDTQLQRINAVLWDCAAALAGACVLLVVTAAVAAALALWP